MSVRLFRIMIAVACLTGVSRADTTSDVYRVDALLLGAIESGVSSNPILSNVKITTDDMINFGLARDLHTPVEDYKILAIAKDCTNNTLRLIVYDSNLPANTVTIAHYTPVVEVAGTRKGDDVGQIVGDLVIVQTGDGTNGFTGGSLKLSASTTGKKDVCLGSLKGSMLGNVETVFPLILTNFPTTNCVQCVTNSEVVNCATNQCWDGTTNIVNTVLPYNVAVSKGTLRTLGKRLAQLIENPE